jgi:hypothetical protein
MFEAHWERVKVYRKMLTMYLLAYIFCISATSVIINITCLTMIRNKNQLFITVIENLILSIISIVLAGWATWKLKPHLAYTEPKKDKLKFRPAKSDSDSDSWEDY